MTLLQSGTSIPSSTTFVAHKILQFLGSDILGSYSYVKMKSLWDIKNNLEKES